MKKTSKFRNVRGAVGKRDQQWSDYSGVARASEGNVLGVSSVFFAAVYGSGRDVALGTLDTPSTRGGPTLLARCDGVVTDVQFSCCDETLFAVGLDTGALRVLRAPSVPHTADSVCEAVSELRGAHNKRVTCLQFCPAAAHVLASAAADGTCVVWANDKAAFKLPHPPQPVQALAWSPDGTRLLTLHADKRARVWDPRKTQIVAEWAQIHDGVKASAGTWLTNDVILTAGFNKARERQLQVWSVSENKQLAKVSLDSGTGLLSVVSDPTSGLVFVAGRGDASIRVFEWFEGALSPLDPTGDPTLPVVSIAALPKRSVKCEQCEVFRLYAVLGSQSTTVAPISFVAPRKIVKFYDELFEVNPPSGQAACTAEEWASGWTGAIPTTTMDPALRAGGDLSTKQLREKKQEEERNFRRWDNVVEEPNEEALAAALAAANKVDVESAEVKQYEGVQYKQVQVVRSSLYRHLYGAPFAAKDCITGLPKPPAEGTLISCSSKFFAVPAEGPGGRLAVVPTSFAGRLPDNFSMIETGSPVVDFCFNTFHPEQLVTGQDTGVVMLWNLPAEGLSLKKGSANVNRETLRLGGGHRRRVTSMAFNSVADNILCTVSSLANDLRIWDVAKGVQLQEQTEQVDGAYNVSWNWNGSLLSTICKDGKVRVLDLRNAAKRIVGECAAHDLPEKASCITWAGEHRLLSAGFAKGSQRQLRVYDNRKLDRGAIATHNMDVSNGAMTLHYDNGTGVVFVAGKGDVSVTMLELTNEEEKCIHDLTAFRGKDAQTGVCFMPKQSCDIKEVEIARMLKLTVDSRVEPVRIIVPRQRKEYFQDDVFADAPSITKPAQTAEQWSSGATCAGPVMESLKPNGMTALSVAPPPQKEKKPTSAYYLAQAKEQQKAKDDAESLKDTLFQVSTKFKDADTKKNDADAEVKDDEW